MTKNELRRYIREEKRHFTQQQLGEMSLHIMSRLLQHPRVAEAETILMYHSLPDEVNTHDALDQLLAMGKKVLLPKVISDTEMTIHEYTGPDSLVPSEPYGILEPKADSIYDFQAAVDAITSPPSPITKHLIVVPGMAFDGSGHRLGRGKGYYDRFLSRVPNNIYKIGVCFPFQMVQDVPSESTDILMDEVICEAER